MSSLLKGYSALQFGEKRQQQGYVIRFLAWLFAYTVPYGPYRCLVIKARSVKILPGFRPIKPLDMLFNMKLILILCKEKVHFHKYR
jgi:hypothetical protein